MDSEETVIKKAKSGDSEAFTLLYEKYFHIIYGFIFVKSNGDKALTEDICSETFCKIYQKLNEYQEQKGNFKSRIYTIAYHSFIDTLKNQKEQGLHESEQGVNEKEILHRIDTKSQAQKILEYLESIGPDKKDLFLLRMQERLRYKEIAEILGKSEESCRKECNRILKKLIEKYEYLNTF